MDNLLTLVKTERAAELRFVVGQPPVIVGDTEEHMLEGPPITDENAHELLRSIANTRHMRELREKGEVVFLYKLHGTSPFLVRARLRNGAIAFEIL